MNLNSIYVFLNTGRNRLFIYFTDLKEILMLVKNRREIFVYIEIKFLLKKIIKRLPKKSREKL